LVGRLQRSCADLKEPLAQRIPDSHCFQPPNGLTYFGRIFINRLLKAFGSAFVKLDVEPVVLGDQIQYRLRQIALLGPGVRNVKDRETR
jgi:hypothetical protein